MKIISISRPGPATARAGFSLVEMMAVVMIMGLLATLVAIDWRALLPRSELNATVRLLAATISGTRSDSIARSAEFGVEYDIDGKRWRVVTPYRRGGGTLAASFEERTRLSWQHCKPSVEIAAVWVDGEEFTQNPGGRSIYVRFDPLGASSAHTIVLRQPEYGNHFTVEVLALTGLVRMHDGIFVREVVDDGSFAR